MRLGIDFDNTIVCYDALFHKVAREGKWIPEDLPVNKSEVRNYLRRMGHEPVWTEMQGCVYGGRMSEAAPYPGVLEFLRDCRQKGLSFCIISHKTRYPFLGEKFDLHQSAFAWLEQYSFFDIDGIGLSRKNVFFELTKEAKLSRINDSHCTHFIDDLPEFLGEKDFPPRVHRILFDPNELYRDERRFERMTSWNDASQFLSRAAQAQPHLSPLPGLPVAIPFLRKHGVEGDYSLKPLDGGANNRVYAVETSERKWLLKVYFHSSSDNRDRFGVERQFYEFIQTCGIERTPEPLGWDSENRLGLFGLVDGRKLQANEVSEHEIEQAIDFLMEINQAKDRVNAETLPAAAEACFSVAEHIGCIDKRVARCSLMDGQSGIDFEAQAFVRANLEPAWKEIRSSIVENTSTGELDRMLEPRYRCLSPSDFGFHNALLAKNGRLYFIDFEYAGWDDPAKLICDFFCQPQVPPDLRFWNQFTRCLSSSLAGSGSLAERARILLPAYQVKWCCIMLNEFARSERARRDFSLGEDTSVNRKSAQLQKARLALKTALQTWTGKD